jgi:RNA polymerase sigma-32 factor
MARQVQPVHFYGGRPGNAAPLDRNTELRLVKRWQAGDPLAGDRVVMACLPLVLAIATQYRHWGIPIDDIVQQGAIGVLRAAAKFDATKECRLSTYAAYWIRAEIREYLVRGYRVVRLGTTKAEKRALRAYRKTKESDPTVLAAVSGMTRERAEWLLPILAGREASLDTRGVDRGEMLERLAGPGLTPEEEASAHEHRGRARAAVTRALRGLTERERMIVRERWMSDEPRTLRELGARMGVSKERVRQIEERVRDKLRARLGDMREEAA